MSWMAFTLERLIGTLQPMARGGGKRTRAGEAEEANLDGTLPNSHRAPIAWIMERGMMKEAAGVEEAVRQTDAVPPTTGIMIATDIKG